MAFRIDLESSSPDEYVPYKLHPRAPGAFTYQGLLSAKLAPREKYSITIKTKQPPANTTWHIFYLFWPTSWWPPGWEWKKIWEWQRASHVSFRLRRARATSAKKERKAETKLALHEAHLSDWRKRRQNNVGGQRGYGSRGSFDDLSSSDEERSRFRSHQAYRAHDKKRKEHRRGAGDWQ